MANKLLISLSATQVSAARWRGRAFARCELFANDEAGLAAFQEYLATAGNAPVYIMVDAVEEDYRFESLPHSVGGDRREMVARKLRQYYRNTPYLAARLIGRDAGRRRDDHYMFAALTNPEMVSPWVQAVVARGLPIAGVYLLPTVGQGLLYQLQIKLPNLLVLSTHAAGLRLTYFRDQQLRISRLARLDDSGPQAFKNYATEISNTRLYLHALRIMTLDEQLTVLIVDRNDSLGELSQVIGRDSPNIDCQRLGRSDIVSRVGIAASTLDSWPDALYLHLLGLHAPGANLASADITVGFRRHQARRMIYAATGVAAFAAIAWCAFNLYQVADNRADTENASRETAELQALYQKATLEFPAAPASAENLQRTVEISQRIGTVMRSPEGMLALVSQALERHPTIAIHTFGWKYGRTDIEVDPARGAKALGETAPANAPAKGPAGITRRQSGLLAGEVRPFRGDYRAAIEAINRFAETLAQQPGVAEIRIVKLPLSVSPNLTLSGNTADTRDQGGKAEFKLLMVLKQSL